ncbi:MAG: tRNA glutamyl-Q(34) synthetase GluQRS [Casimicrobiaceae bacterium]
MAAVASHADARHVGGEWFVRIDDIDVARARRDAADRILATLADHGMRSDREIAWQSQRLLRYDEAFAALRAQHAVYACSCSRAALAHGATGPLGEPIYPGTCRDAAAPIGGNVAWRMRVADARVAFTDRVQGPQRQSLAEAVGDFIVKRSDGLYAYQLAIAVDDGDDDISDVVRGADLLASTPRQILLQRALGLPTPRYLHVPVAVNADGTKLSKSTDARALDAAPVSALCAAWHFLGQSPRDGAPATVAQFWEHALRAWSPSRIPAVATLACPPAYAWRVK